MKAPATIKFLCVDDERPDQLEPLLDRLRANAIDVELAFPAPFDEQVDAICQTKMNGVILDLRLDNVANAVTGDRVRYRALALAQELRTRMTEGLLRPFPIILWSVEHKFQQSYNRDATGHDLFDLVVSKPTIAKSVEVVAPKLIALSMDYAKLERGRQPFRTWVARVFGLSSAELQMLDSRVLDDMPDSGPTHDRARFVVQELLERPGVLVAEDIVAARLGVDRQGRAFASVLNSFDTARYKGVFASGWTRWWWPIVEAEWRRLTGTERLRSLSAADRVNLLRKAVRSRSLRPAGPLKSKADRFWYVCAALGVPIDPVDAVLTVQQQRRAWQDQEYVSIEAAVSRQADALGYRIDPMEQPRLESFIKARQHDEQTS